MGRRCFFSQVRQCIQGERQRQENEKMENAKEGYVGEEHAGTIHEASRVVIVLILYLLLLYTYMHARQACSHGVLRQSQHNSSSHRGINSVNSQNASIVL